MAPTPALPCRCRSWGRRRRSESRRRGRHRVGGALAWVHQRRVATTLDTGPVKVHTRGMRPHRLTVPDARGQGASLRVTRHPEQRKVVLSHWRDGRCVASTPIELSEVSALIGVLADALGEAIDTAVPGAPAPPRHGFITAARNWLRPKLAPVTELRVVRAPASERVG